MLAAVKGRSARSSLSLETKSYPLIFQRSGRRVGTVSGHVLCDLSCALRRSGPRSDAGSEVTVWDASFDPIDWTLCGVASCSKICRGLFPEVTLKRPASNSRPVLPCLADVQLSETLVTDYFGNTI